MGFFWGIHWVMVNGINGFIMDNKDFKTGLALINQKRARIRVAT